jgi:hypothetical protein
MLFGGEEGTVTKVFMGWCGRDLLVPKLKRAMGFLDLKTFNQAILAKQG